MIHFSIKESIKVKFSQQIWVITLLLFKSGLCFAAVQKSDAIAIIGAGASGLTTAHTLNHLGYTNVTVYEKEDRVGGKVYTHEHEGNLYEIGAFWAGDGYDVVDSLAETYGVTFHVEDSDFIVRDDEGEEYSMDNFMSKNFNTWQITRGFFAWRKVVKKYRNLTKPNGLFLYDDPDLHLPFGQFIEKYKQCGTDEFSDARSYVCCEQTAMVLLCSFPLQ